MRKGFCITRTPWSPPSQGAAGEPKGGWVPGYNFHEEFSKFGPLVSFGRPGARKEIPAQAGGAGHFLYLQGP